MRLRRGFTVFLKFALPLVFIIGSTAVCYLYEPHGSIGLVFHQRAWIQREILPLSPLAGCFKPERISPLYNVSDAVYGRKRFEVQAGVPMRMGMDCYDLAGIVRFAEGERKAEEQYIPPEERAQFHTYWRVDLAPLGERQEYMLKSFFATQDLPRSRLILWSNGDLSLYSVVQKYLELFPGSFTLQIVDIPELAKGTAMENHRLLNLEDKKSMGGRRPRPLTCHLGIWRRLDRHGHASNPRPLSIARARIRNAMGLLRQDLPTVQRCAHALSQALALPLRSLPSHGTQHSPALSKH